MNRLLDTSNAKSIADTVIDFLEDEGYTDLTEIIPGLVQSIVQASYELTSNSREQEMYLDAAANLLADGGVTD